MTTATFISTAGEYLEAIIEVNGQRLTVMDEFSLFLADSLPKTGELCEVEFNTYLDEDETWEEIFAGNPDKLGLIEQIEGWRYRAFGKIISVNPVVVDCGLLQVEGVVCSTDPRLIGEYVAFSITRLGAYLCRAE